MAAAIVLGISGCATLPKEQRAPSSVHNGAAQTDTVQSRVGIIPSPNPVDFNSLKLEAPAPRLNSNQTISGIRTSAGANSGASSPFTNPLLGSGFELQKLLHTAWLQHPQVTAAEAEARAARAEIPRAGALMDPQLNLTQGLDDTSRTGLSLSQRLPLFGQRGLAAERAQYQAQAAEAGLRQTQGEVTRQVLSDYAEYAYVREAHSIVEQQHGLLRQMLDVARTRYRVGAVGQGDLLRLESELDRLENQKVSIQEMVPVSAVRLNAALGRSPREPLPETLSLELLPLRIESDELAQYLERHNPQLQMLKHQQSAGRTARTLAGRSGRPDLMVGVEHMRGGDMGAEQTNIMLGINLPIWRGSYRAQQDQAEANLQAVTGRLLDRQQQLHADLSMVLFNLQEAQRNYRLYQEVLVPRAEQALEANLTAYRSGDAAFADLIDSQREWLSFQLNQKRALADALQWQGELIFLLGVDALLPTGEVLQ